MPRRRSVVFASVTVGLVLTACQLIVGVKDEVGVARPDDASFDAGPTEASAAEAQPAAICGDAMPPGPAPTTDLPSNGVLTFAVSQMHVRHTGDAPLGYNLDGRCTSKSDLVNQRPCSGTTGDDDPGGADNEFGNVVDDFKGLLTGDAGPDPPSKAINRGIGNGVGTMLLSIGGYGGFDGGTAFTDDSKVTLSLAPSAGLQGSGCGADAGDAGGAPLADGCDLWSVVPDAATGSPLALYKGGGTGYVRGGVLVVHAEVLTLVFDKVTITFHSAVVSATLSNEDGVHKLKNGVIAGRISARELTASVLMFSLTSDGKTPVCQVSGEPGLIRAAFCGRRDIPLSPMDDGKILGGKLVDCDAVSIALGFDAVAATVGTEGAPSAASDCPMDFDAGCE